MGLRIQKQKLLDENTFKNRARRQLKKLKLRSRGERLGVELEVTLINPKTLQRSKNAPQILNNLINGSSSFIFPELGKDCVELITDPIDLGPGFLNKLERVLHDRLNFLRSLANTHGSDIVLHGMWPFYLEETYSGNCPEILTDNPRYRLLESRLRDLKAEVNEQSPLTPLTNDSDPIGPVHVTNTASFQLNISTNPSSVVPMFNAALFAAPILTRIFANSPFLYGLPFYSESRIFVFEESTSVGSHRQCTFPSLMVDFKSYIEDSFDTYRAMLPLDVTNSLDLYLSTLWLWVRPKIYVSDGVKVPGFEIRNLPTCGTIREMLAAAALNIALIKVFSQHVPDRFFREQQAILETSFYDAVRGKNPDILIPEKGAVKVVPWERFELNLSRLFDAGLKMLGEEKRFGDFWKIISSLLVKNSAERQKDIFLKAKDNKLLAVCQDYLSRSGE